MSLFRNIVILTGAGISAESGVATFRDKGGIWSRYRVEDVATPEAFRRNPELVHDFYNARRQGLKGIAPNAAHAALARLEREHAGSVTLVTQNIDNLHEAAGSQNLIHMHGELLKSLCALCGDSRACDDDLSLAQRCPNCGKRGGLRPDVVWFGEMPYHLDRIATVLDAVDLFISIGTSGNVYPAAGFVQIAHQAGAHTVELNLEPSEGASLFAETIHGPATMVVPSYVEKLLSAA